MSISKWLYLEGKTKWISGEKPHSGIYWENIWPKCKKEQQQSMLTEKPKDRGMQEVGSGATTLRASTEEPTRTSETRISRAEISERRLKKTKWWAGNQEVFGSILKVASGKREYQSSSTKANICVRNFVEMWNRTKHRDSRESLKKRKDTLCFFHATVLCSVPSPGSLAFSWHLDSLSSSLHLLLSICLLQTCLSIQSLSFRFSIPS